MLAITFICQVFITLWPDKLTQQFSATYCTCNTVACSMLHKPGHKLSIILQHVTCCISINVTKPAQYIVHRAKMLCLFMFVWPSDRIPLYAYLILKCRPLSDTCIFHQQTSQESLLIFHPGRKQGPFVSSYITVHTAGSHSFCSGTWACNFEWQKRDRAWIVDRPRNKTF